jgi:L-lactate dehydrogenase (cytochrome)
MGNRAMTCIDDLRRLAQRRTPSMFFDYVDSGSWSESTLRANMDDLAAIKFRQRVGRDISDRSVTTSIVGEACAMPLVLAPAGFAGMVRADGEVLAARAAERFGVPFTLSTVSICSIEDVAAATTRPFWFQVYVMKDRNFVERLVARAKDAGCSALILTLDLQIQGQRHKDIRNGLSAPPRLGPANLFRMVSKPGWCLSMLQTRRHSFGNIVGHAVGVSSVASFAEWVSEQFDPTFCWKDVRWIRRLWPGKLILKGVMDVEDAKVAAQTGADAIVVSNHGGRQLDGAPSSISALPDIVDAVGNRVEVLFDGGVRSGQDVLRALALGARGVLAGRAWLYGLGALGEAGVTRSLEIIRKELDSTMALCGVSSIGNVDRSVIMVDGR